jgi:arginine exporter protein ArgO
MAPLMSRPATWRVLDLVIGVVMLGVAFNVATTHVVP